MVYKHFPDSILWIRVWSDCILNVNTQDYYQYIILKFRCLVRFRAAETMSCSGCPVMQCKDSLTQVLCSFICFLTKNSFLWACGCKRMITHLHTPVGRFSPLYLLPLHWRAVGGACQFGYKKTSPLTNIKGEGERTLLPLTFTYKVCGSF